MRDNAMNTLTPNGIPPGLRYKYTLSKVIAAKIASKAPMDKGRAKKTSSI